MIKKLLAIRLRGTFLSAIGGKDKNGNPKSVSKGKTVGYAFLYAFIALVFLGIVLTLAAPFAMILLPYGAENMYFGVFMLLSLSVIFIFSIFETKSELYECKDNELLLAMPISARDIVISRIFTVLIYNYAVELIILIPVLVCYIVFGGNAVGILGSLFVFATVPLVATALAAGVGYAVHLLSHKLARYKNLIIMLLSVACLMLYFVFCTALMENLEQALEGLEGNVGAITQKYTILSHIGSVATFSAIPLVIYTTAVALITSVAVIVISRKYTSLITADVKTAKSVYVAKELKGKSALAALTKKEFLKLISSPTYMLNGALGFVFQIAVAILIVVMGPELLNADPELLAELGITEDAMLKITTPLFIGILVFTESMVMLSCSAVSLEGKNLWILKSMPIPEKTVLMSKAMPQILLSVAVSTVSGLIAGIGIGASFADVLFFVLIPMVFGVFSSLLGIIVNVLLPKFDFINDVQVIKQSAAVFVTMIINILVSLAVMLALFTSMSVKYPSAILLAVLAVASLICAALYLVICGPISKRYSRF